MRIEKLNCSNCGATLEVDADAQIIECRFCGTRLMIEIDKPGQPVPGIISGKHAAELNEWFKKIGLDKEVYMPETEFALDLSFKKPESQDLKYLEYVPNLIFLNLEGAAIDDSACAYLQKLKFMEYIIISDTAITDLGFVASMPNIKTIRAMRTKITDDGLRGIQDLPKLKTLDLYNTDVTDAGMQYMKNLQALEELDLNGSMITIEGLKIISGLPNLRKVSYPGSIHDIDFFRAGILNMIKVKTSVGLSSCGITDAELALLENMTALETLILSRNKITDNGLSSFKGLSRLSYLDLASNKITDGGIEQLAGLKRLRTLDLKGNRVTQKGAASLKKMLPSVNITV